jgi:hypothetical protein
MGTALGIGIGIPFRRMGGGGAPPLPFVWGTATAVNWGSATTQTWG